MIESRKYYPRRARKMHQTGKVEVAFTIGRNGTITDLRVSDPCRYRSLNKAALKTLKKIGRFKPLPDVFGDRLVLRIPIRYELKSY
jgi:protein TonB